MVRRWAVAAILFTVGMVVIPVMGQEKPASKPPERSFYKLDLTTREMDGSKVVNTRSYTMNVGSGEWSKLRVGSRFPYTPARNGGPLTETQYIDLGLSADFRMDEVEAGPTLMWTIDLSNAAPESVASGMPVIRNLRSQGATLLAVGKPALLSTSDDLNSTHKFVFEVTATKVK